MLRQNFNLFVSVLFIVINCFSAIKSDSDKQNDQLKEELTGIKKNAPLAATVKKNPQFLGSTISEKHLFAGLDAFKVKNYILALKHYNTVIIKHSKSKDVKSAYLAKSKLYSEMGLKTQAEQNLQKALLIGNTIKK